MASRKLSEHTAITGANVNPAADYIEILDVSDTTDAASGTNKKILPSEFIAAMGLTPTVTELNYVDGVTSAIQTQLNAKEPLKGADDNYVTDAQLVVIGNTSGTNTGDNAVNSTYASAKTKTDFITVTQNVDLDTIESRVNELDASVVLKGSWDASAGTFPGAGIAQAGWSYIVSVGGTVDSVVFVANDRIVCILDNGSTTTYASNWLKLDYTDAVLSVDGNTGALTLGAIIAALTGKTTPVDADTVVLSDSAASNASKKVTWANIKATLLTYIQAGLAMTGVLKTAARQTIAAATTVDLNSATSNTIYISGSGVSISSLGTTLTSGTYTLVFAGINTIVHSSTLQCPNNANITTEADMNIVVECISGGVFVQSVHAKTGTAENTLNKDVSGGYTGLTLLKINFKNVANTFTSFFTNSNTAARTYTFPDSTGTVALTSDITDAGLSTTDVTTNNATTAKHGFLKKLSNSASDYMDGTGNWSVPPGGSASDSFKTIAVSGQSDVIADSSTDTLTLVAGTNISITTNAGTDSITITGTGAGSGDMTEAEFNPTNISEQLVGLTATQTLTNKTLTEPIIGGTPNADGEIGYDNTYKALSVYGNGQLGTIPKIILRGNGTESKTNSTSADQDYTSIYTIPANTIYTGKMYKISVCFQVTTGTSTATHVTYLKLGATKVAASTASNFTDGTSSQANWVDLYIYGEAAAGGAAAVITSYVTSRATTGLNTISQPINLATNGTLDVVLGATWSATGSTETVVMRDWVIVEY